jgi:hypothetical protein
MRYCNRMKRDCTCNKLVTYDRKGSIQGCPGGAGCLTDSEIRSTLGILLREWRKRCMEMELGAPTAGYH